MAYLLALTVIQVLIIILFSQTRTLRDERGEILRLLVGVAIAVLIIKYLITVFDPHVNILFTTTSSLCLVSLTSLYLRNIILEIRTSGYLFLIAVFPFLLFYVFFFLYNLFSSRITDGMIYDYLDFFQQKTRTILFSMTIIYDLFLLWPWRKKLHKLSESIDGQLAIVLFFIKILVISLVVCNGLLIDRAQFLDFPESIYTFLTLFSIVLFRYSRPSFIYFNYVFKGDRLRRNHKKENTSFKHTELMILVSEMDQLIDQEKLFRNPNLILRDLRNSLNLSNRELNLINRLYLNNNFERYLNVKRLAYFLERLTGENHNRDHIQNLLLEAGFKNNGEFDKFFKNEFGCSVWKYVENKNIALIS